MSKFAAALSVLLIAAPISSVAGEVSSPIIVAQSTERAPLGTYKATLGSTTLSSAVASGPSARRVRRNIPSTQGVQISVQLNSYSSQEELNIISNAGENTVIPTLSKYNHGTVTIAGKTHPINLAVSYRRGNSYRINIISAKPYGANSPQGGSVQGNTYGAIALVIPIVDGATGTGTMFTMMGSRLSNFEDEVLSGGVTATTTPLQGVKLN